MKIEQTNIEVKDPTYKNCYKIIMDFMIGDADGDEESVVFVTKDNPNIEEFLKCLEMCSKAFDETGMGGCDTFSDVPGYGKFFGDEDDDEEEEDDYEESDEDEYDEDEDVYDDAEEIQDRRIRADHPYQPDGMGIECSFEGYSITHFDGDGKEFAVDVTFTEDEKEEMRKKLKKAGYTVAKKWS